MRQIQKLILTNMCMIYDGLGNVLVQNRTSTNWPGITFPGGHVELNESITESTIREIKEETGLDIWNLELCGIKHWVQNDGLRYMVILFKTKNYSGQITSSTEGEVYWVNQNDLKHSQLANGFDEMLKVFLNDKYNEFYYYQDELGEWSHKIL